MTWRADSIPGGYIMAKKFPGKPKHGFRAYGRIGVTHKGDNSWQTLPTDRFKHAKCPPGRVLTACVCDLTELGDKWRRQRTELFKHFACITGQCGSSSCKIEKHSAAAPELNGK